MALPFRSKKAPRERAVRAGSAFQLFTTGVSSFDISDPFHLVATMSWPMFFCCLLASELIINSVFALLYIAVPGAIANVRSGSLADAFFFSIETLATVGYGSMVPASLYGHVISAIEIICGMVYAAVMTGVIFIRFSKPKPKIIYATHPVVANHNGAPTLMIRIANGRTNVLTDATAKLYAILTEITPEGHRFRSARTLELSRPNFPLFALTWTLMHKLDANSPLVGCTPDSLVADSVRFMLTFEARDPAISTHVHDLKDYMPETVAFGMRYSDAVSWDESGRTTADIRKVSLIEEDAPPSRALRQEQAAL